jgi:omega-hydroxy-beta-dihydromenaquinone-9 sulfotransferase
MGSNVKSPPHLLTGTSLAHWMRLKRRYGPIAPRASRRARKITIGSMLLGPAQCYETLRYGRAVAKVELHPAPVFIIGHWQGGHSFLHYLMSQDEAFGHVTLLHTVLPRCFLSLESVARRFLRKKLGKTRGVDSFALSLDAPQGDDMALAGLSDVSIYHAYTFPRHAVAAFRRAVLLEGLSASELDRWRTTYYRFLRKVSFHTKRPRLVLRNATNTGRIPQILKIFPQAKFVHLRRNPFAVYAAQSRRWSELLALWALQDERPQANDDLVFDFYREMMERYFADSASLPANQLAEVAYEDLVKAPLQTVRNVYNQLELPGFEQAEPRMSAYLAAEPGRLAGDDVVLDAAACQRVAQHWGFAIERWGYRPPAVSAAGSPAVVERSVS